MSFVEVKQKKGILKKENKIFRKQFITTEPMKYGLKFRALSIVIKRKKTYQEMSFVEVKPKKKKY